MRICFCQRAWFWLLTALFLPGALPGYAIDAQARAVLEQLRAGELTCRLDAFLNAPEIWEMTPDKLEATFKLPKEAPTEVNPYFAWLTTDRKRAHFSRRRFSDLRVVLSVLEGTVPVEEAIVDFEDGRIQGITLSIFNRGDSGKISQPDFSRHVETCFRHLSGVLEVRPFERKANPSQGLLVSGWLWTSEAGKATIETNPEAVEGHPEFLRVRLAPRDATGSVAAAMRERHSAVRMLELKEHLVREEDGDVRIEGIPMVDQGPKGYCVVACCQRLFEYYGIPCDQHQLAQIVGAEASSGTAPKVMAEALNKIDYRFRTRFKRLLVGKARGEKLDVSTSRHKVADEDRFLQLVQRSIDKGVPLFWGLKLGIHPESGERRPRQTGGHMRLISGYNAERREIIFTDSWGAGHERKRMHLTYAFEATTCLYWMKPAVQ